LNLRACKDGLPGRCAADYLDDTLTAHLTLTIVVPDAPTVTYGTECYTQDDTFVLEGAAVCRVPA
jgi:hypothetical protein